jgi:AraC family transcriptional regulator
MNRIKVAEMAHAGRLSESYFKALFRQAMGVPPAEFLRVLRLEHAQLRLRTTHDAITDVALDAGFSSSQHFAAAFRQHFGCAPRTFRKKPAEPVREAESRHGAGVAFHPTAAED